MELVGKALVLQKRLNLLTFNKLSLAGSVKMSNSSLLYSTKDNKLYITHTSFHFNENKLCFIISFILGNNNGNTIGHNNGFKKATPKLMWPSCWYELF